LLTKQYAYANIIMYMKYKKETPKTDFVKREAQGNPWVEEALQQRENAIDELVEQGGALADEEYHHQYRHTAHQAEVRKAAAGIEQPEPLLTESIAENR
jgi:hypothetical protein